LTWAGRRDAPPGFAGCAPCRLCRHGHSASIPPAFAPAALRASLASRGSAQGPSPPRAAWRPSNAAEPAAPDRLGQRPAAMVTTRSIRRSLLREVVRMRVVLDARGSRPSFRERWFTDTTPGLAMELPRHLLIPALQGRWGRSRPSLRCCVGPRQGANQRSLRAGMPN
jgi:hypothetical protein